MTTDAGRDTSDFTLRQSLMQRLWKKCFDDLRKLVDGLTAFSIETELEDEFPVTFQDFVERISFFVNHIEVACPPSLFAETNQGDLERVSGIIDRIHVELRLQRDAILQDHFRRVPEPKFRLTFGIARQKFNELSTELNEALEDLISSLTEEAETAVESTGGE